ncbi:MAG TPA: hypothetical protein VGA70_07700, partial [Longimicrobiales bacterium]
MSDVREPFYVMKCPGTLPGTMLQSWPDHPESPWMRGTPVEPLDGSAIFTLSESYPGNLKAWYEASIPLIRDDLREALEAAGVDNLQTFDAILVEPWSGAEHANYKAVNIVGIASAVDEEHSERAPGLDLGMAATFFDSLSVDATKANGLLMFRLAESVNAIVVHQCVVDAIRGAGIPGMF